LRLFNDSGEAVTKKSVICAAVKRIRREGRVEERSGGERRAQERRAEERRAEERRAEERRAEERRAEERRPILLAG
jgi:hypothetical protein